MPSSEQLTNRIRELLADTPDVEEKQMFHGATFLVNNKLCFCIGSDEMLCRIDPALHDEALEQQGIRSMEMKGKAVKGYVYVNEAALQSNKELAYWVKLALAYNPKAKAAKKKR